MSKMVDLGRSIKEDKAQLPKKWYQSITLYGDVPDDLMNAEMGKMYKFEAIGKVVTKAKEEKSKERLVIELHKIGLLGKAGFEQKKD